MSYDRVVARATTTPIDASLRQPLERTVSQFMGDAAALQQLLQTITAKLWTPNGIGVVYSNERDTANALADWSRTLTELTIDIELDSAALTSDVDKDEDELADDGTRLWGIDDHRV